MTSVKTVDIVTAADAEAGVPDATIAEIEECTICMEIIKERGSIDSCRHTFCFQCILDWSKVTNKCPICQASFVKVTEVMVEKPPEYDAKGKKKRTRKPKTRNIRKKQQRVDYAETGFAIARNNDIDEDDRARSLMMNTIIANMFNGGPYDGESDPWHSDEDEDDDPYGMPYGMYGGGPGGRGGHRGIDILGHLNRIMNGGGDDDDDINGVDSDSDDDEVQEITDLRQINRSATLAEVRVPTTRSGQTGTGAMARRNARRYALNNPNNSITSSSSSSTTSASSNTGTNTGARGATTRICEVIDLVSDDDIVPISSSSSSSSSNSNRIIHTISNTNSNNNSNNSNDNSNNNNNSNVSV